LTALGIEARDCWFLQTDDAVQPLH
jgi:hypothetical protein